MAANRTSTLPIPAGTRLPGRRGRVLLGSGMLVAATILVPATPAAAAGPVSQAEGRFLSGSAAGSELASLLAVNAATATNTGGPDSVQTAPVGVTALNSVDIGLGSGVNLLGSNGILALGAANQYAAARADGSSAAASGAVTDSGAIAAGGSASYPADASLDLQPLLGGVASALSDLKLNSGALSATSQQTVGGVQTGDYQIDGLGLNLTSPLVSGIYSNLRTTLVGLQPTVNGLPALIRALPGVGPLATITGLPNLATLADTLGTVTSADGSITANLQTGAVTVDLGQVLSTVGLDLNDLPPNTDLMPYLTAALTSQLLPAISTALTNLASTITSAVNGISVSVLGIPVALVVLAPVLNPVIAQLVAPLTTATADLSSTVLTPLGTALATVLGLQANLQQVAAGTFTERALQVSLLPTAAIPAAVLELASASVGPNAGPSAPALPSTSSLTPSSGPSAGGQTVTVTGTDFVVGATSVTIGGLTVPAGQVTVTSPTSLSFSTPPHPVGDVGVTVSTAGGTSSPALDYRYLAAPSALGLTPDTGPVAGGQTVAVTGSGFVVGATSVTIGATTIPAGSVTVLSAGSLTFSTPPHVAGTVGVTVTTPAGTSTPALAYSYLDGPGVAPPAPVISTPTDGATISDPTPVIGGTGVPGDAVTVHEGGATICAAITDPNGHWQCVPASGFPLGKHTITATQQDTAGVSSAESDPVSFTVAESSLGDTVSAAAGPGSGGSLAYTGSNLLDLLMLALALMGVGAAASAGSWSARGRRRVVVTARR